jgi:hypothetical protein
MFERIRYRTRQFWYFAGAAITAGPRAAIAMWRLSRGIERSLIEALDANPRLTPLQANAVVNKFINEQLGEDDA